jgi:hypothetical protein
VLRTYVQRWSLFRLYATSLLSKRSTAFSLFQNLAIA